MLFSKNKKEDDNNTVSAGSVGAKIKRIRELRKLTQKELGCKAGYTESTADVRIAQYEKNVRVPQKQAMIEIAEALGINQYALFDLDLTVLEQMYQIMYDLEDYYGLHPVRMGKEKIVLEFDIPSDENSRTSRDNDVIMFLKEWLEKREKYLTNGTDLTQDANRKDEYALWRREYPDNEIKEKIVRMQEEQNMRIHQAEVDKSFAKINSEKARNEIEDRLLKLGAATKVKDVDLRRMSNFIWKIKDVIEKGLIIEHETPDCLSDLKDSCHLFSIKKDDILSSDEKTLLYETIVKCINQLVNRRINIEGIVTSKNKELYISYVYSESDNQYFVLLHKYWDDMLKVIERKQNPKYRKSEWEGLETKLIRDIEGPGDLPIR